MSELFLNLRQSIPQRANFDNPELKEYALFITEHIPSIKKSYEQNLASQLESWLEILSRAIQSTLNSKQTNQIGPKLELIYTTVINQQQTVNQHIKNIAELILTKKYCFQDQQQAESKKSGLKYTQTSQTTKFQGFMTQNNENETVYYNRQKTISKGRSLSNGSQRRRLSKASCFAQAKKLEITSNNFVQTATATEGFYKHSTGQKIKKTKKKEENGFAYLEKCMSSTSPSNFMLGYMARTEHGNNVNRQPQQTRRRSIDKKEQKYNESIVVNDAPVHHEKSQLTVPLQSQGHHRNDSGTYEKMMINFQQKIGQKLDELMSKYSKIQQKLQQSQLLQASKKEIKSEPQYSIAVHAPLEIKQNQPSKPKTQDLKAFTSNTVQMTMPAQNKVTFVERQVKKVIKEKQNSEKQVSHVKGANNNINKSILAKNKIVRNKVQQSAPLQDSIESIILPKTSLKSLNVYQSKNLDPSMLSLGNSQPLQSKKVIKSKIQEDSPPSQASQQMKNVPEDHSYLVKQITEFNKTTLKVILPISKKLLFIIKHKYSAFCSLHNLELNKEIKEIQGEEVKNEVLELKDSLEKMEKILQLKCNEEKKQKLLFYVCSFLDCYLSFGDQNTIVRLPNEVMSEQVARSKIRQAMGKLK